MSEKTQDTKEDNQLYKVLFEGKKYSVIKYPDHLAVYLNGHFAGTIRYMFLDEETALQLIQDANKGEKKNKNTRKSKCLSECLDCGLDYDEFQLDITLPNNQWELICPEDGILCPNDIAGRASKIPQAIAIRAVIDIDPCDMAAKKAKPDLFDSHMPRVDANKRLEITPRITKNKGVE